MKLNADFMDALEVIERDKGVPKEALLEALANALVTAYKRLPRAADEAVVSIDPDTGDINVFAHSTSFEVQMHQLW